MTRYKYSISINQFVLANEESLDIVDCAILAYLIDYCNSTSPAVEQRRITVNNRRFTWVKYSILTQEMPLLRIKDKAAVSRRIQKLIDAGFVEAYREAHQRQYYCLTEKVDLLKFTSKAVDENGELLTKSNSAVDEKQQLPRTELLLKSNRTIISNYTTTDSTQPSVAQSVHFPLIKKVTYLRDISSADVQEFAEKYNLSPERVKKEAQIAYEYLAMKGKRYANYSLYFQSWLRRKAEQENAKSTSIASDYISRDQALKEGKIW